MRLADTGSFFDQIIAYNTNDLPDTVTYQGFTPDGTAVSRSLSLEYNADGQVTLIDGPRTDVSDTTSFEYYRCSIGRRCGQLRKVTNALGQSTDFESYDANGRIKQVTDANGTTTVYTYDRRGNVRTITQTPQSGPARVTSYSYDDARQLRTVTSPEGVVLSYDYDAAHNLISITDSLGNRIVYGYDLNGNRTSEDVYDPSDVLQHTLTTLYDARNRIDFINTAGSVTDLLFDAVGNLTGATDPNQNSTTHQYDSLNRLDDTLDALQGVTDYDYDVRDHLISVKAPNLATTTYEYDDLGNRLKEISPDRGTTQYQYDEAGNLKFKTDARGVTVEYRYDALNRLTEVLYPDSTLNVTIQYDGVLAGYPHSVSDASGTWTPAFDVFGNQLSETRTVDGHTISLASTYDQDDKVKTVSYASGMSVEYVRDAAGQITKIEATIDGQPQTVVDNVQYQPFGPIAQLTFGNGLILNRNFDQAYRVTGETLGSVHSVTYVPDPAGNLTGIVDNLDATHTQGFSYDVLNRLKDESGAYGHKAYVYDANGNRTSRDWDRGTRTTTQSLTYEPSSNRLATRDGQTVGLDAAGNTLEQRQAQRIYTYQYDDAGRLAQAFRDGQWKLTNHYDAYGRRVIALKPSGNTQLTYVFVYSADGRLMSETVLRPGWAHAQAVREVIWLDDMPVAHLRRTYLPSGNLALSQFTYLHADHLNTPRFGTDESQVVVWRLRTDAFGEGAVEVDPDENGQNVQIQLRFPGQYSDGATGVYYNYFRDYDRTTGRYVTSDPIGLVGGLNTYSYARSNPVTLIDPFGLDTAPRSPNPVRPKIPRPPVTKSACAFLYAMDKKRQTELESAEACFQETQRIIEEGCEIRERNCAGTPEYVPTAEAVARCIAEAAAECLRQQEKAFDRSAELLGLVKKGFPVNRDLKSICDLVAGES
jgi:RHS repeat-associated protein